MLSYDYSQGPEAHNWRSVLVFASQLQNLFVMLKPALRAVGFRPTKSVHVDRVNMCKLLLIYCILALK